MVQTQTSDNYKKLKVECKGDDNDKLGSLPEAILSYILSLLSTEEAVRTSVLSTNWRYKWTFVTNLHFDDSACYMYLSRIKKWKKSREVSFIKFVDRVLMLGNSSIEKFYLSSHMGDHDLITKWILAVTKRNPRTISIYCPRVKSSASPCFTFNCGFLAELKLLMTCTIKVVSPNLFQSLKIMELQRVTFLNERLSSSKELRLNFQVLEVLRLSSCQWLNVNVVHINAPKLKRCRIYDDRPKPEDSNGTCEYVLKMCAPRLANLECECYPFAEFILPGPSAFTDLCIVFDLPWKNNWDKRKTSEGARLLLRQFSAAKTLTISSDTIEVLGHEKDSHAHLPKLDNLIQLTLIRSWRFTEEVMAFLHCSPNLESLIFTEAISLKKNSVLQGVVPECLLSHLKIVEFQEFSVFIDDVEDDLELARFLLSNAKALEKMIINFTDKNPAKFMVKEELLKCSRRSTCAKLVFC